jgi:hypothetical protein
MPAKIKARLTNLNLCVSVRHVGNSSIVPEKADLSAPVGHRPEGCAGGSPVHDEFRAVNIGGV